MKTLLGRGAAFLFIGLSVWPAFTVIALIYSYLEGEGSVLNTWYLEPKRNLFAYFLEGLVHSAPIAAALALIALLCGIAPRRLGWIRMLPILLMPAIGVAVAQQFYPNNNAMLICLSLTGLAIGITSLVLGRLTRKPDR